MKGSGEPPQVLEGGSNLMKLAAVLRSGGRSPRVQGSLGSSPHCSVFAHAVPSAWSSLPILFIRQTCPSRCQTSTTSLGLPPSPQSPTALILRSNKEFMCKIEFSSVLNDSV